MISPSLIQTIILTFLLSGISGIKDHVFVFENESVTIDCTEGDEQQDPILLYRKQLKDDPKTYFVGGTERPGTPKGFSVEKVGEFDFLYKIEAAQKENGGEYECDWDSTQDELNHYVNVVDKSSLVCPDVPSMILAGENIEGVECTISKSGALVKEWLSDYSKRDELGLKFTIEDHRGIPFAVTYEETADSLTATAMHASLSKRENGTSIVCKFVTTHGTETKCLTDKIQVYCDETNKETDYCKDPPQVSSGPVHRDSAVCLFFFFFIAVFQTTFV